MAEQANTRPSEASLQFMRSCADTLGDQNGALEALEKLCQHFPKPEYWTSYIRAKLRNATNLASYYWIRLLIEAVPKTAADDYSIFAQQSLSVFNLPATGARAIEQGIAIGAIDLNARQGPQFAKTLEGCRNAALAERERLAGLINGTQPDPTGQVSFEAGRIQFDNDQFDQAIASLTAALEKGRFKEKTNARFMLGIAQLKLGDRDAARVTFDALKSDPTLQAVANAWFVRTYN
jgi:tetratricopeptide (TPR) repeat protein